MYVWGEDMHDARIQASVRQKLGVCPQHNILYDDLTVGQRAFPFVLILSQGGRALAPDGLYQRFRL